jgi:hypothetical protein
MQLLFHLDHNLEEFVAFLIEIEKHPFDNLLLIPVKVRIAA